MRRIFASAALALVAASASATVTSSNTLCWIEVSSPLTNVIVSSALVNIGLPATNVIDVNQFVLPRNLKKGDLLLRKVKNGTTYGWQGWRMSADGDKSGAWTAVNVTEGDVAIAPADDSALSLAKAFLLRRTDPAASNPFYIRGQLESSSPRVQTAEAEYELMSNASIHDVYIEDIPWTVQPSQGDRLNILYDNPTGVMDYVWDATESKWCTNAVRIVGTGKRQRKEYYLEHVANKTVSISVGQGFRLKKSASSTSNPTITWPEPNSPDTL